MSSASTSRRYHQCLLVLIVVAIATSASTIAFVAVADGRRNYRRGGDGRRPPFVHVRARPLRGGGGTTTATPDGISCIGSDTDTSPSSTRISSTRAADDTRSVHLQLKSPAMVASMRNREKAVDKKDHSNDDVDDDNDGKKEKSLSSSDKKKLIKFRTYRDPAANLTIYGLGLPPRKFKLWVNATSLSKNSTSSNAAAAPTYYVDHRHVITEDVDLTDPTVRERMRELWRNSNMISDRTEFLAVYQSEQENQQRGSDDSLHSTTKEGADPMSKRKRGDFPDLLSMYADRLVGIIGDEQEEDEASKVKAARIRDAMRQNMTEAAEMEWRLVDGISGGLVGYLKREYGDNETMDLMADRLLKKSKDEQYATLQTFLDWFRKKFPYYYDRCNICGASAKDDGLLDPCNQSEDEDDTEDDEKRVDASCNEDDEDDDGSTFLGYVYPSETERQGKAGRTEIYCCHQCGAVSRFPRYNSASSVLANRRGRCGEYSMLILRFFRALGHEARWVVDWSDHVWAEICLDGNRWVHIDPCEAAIDNPLLYQSWGKTQTYIMAFHAFHPTKRPRQQQQEETLQLQCIEDVTGTYTSDNSTAIQERRDEDDGLVQSSLSKTKEELQAKLKNVLS